MFNTLGFLGETFEIVNVSGRTANMNLNHYISNNSTWDGTTAKNFKIVLDSTANIYSTSCTSPSMSVGSFPVGTTIYIENSGIIEGKGGGGTAGTGGNGGHAIDTSIDLTIDNTNGNIWGGGGGGGGGLGYIPNGDNPIWGYAYGGNGAGDTPGTGGIGTATESANTDGSYYGGGFGAGGIQGAPGGPPGTSGFASFGYSSNPGGTAGKAINLNGNSVTWLGGSGDPNVKGAVS